MRMMNIRSRELPNFKFEVFIGENYTEQNGGLIFRELRPKDFYTIKLQEENLDFLEIERQLMILKMLHVSNRDDVLENLTVQHFKVLLEWLIKNLLDEKLMRIEDWLLIAFNLQKQRWGADLSWLENQPLPKILAMIEVQTQYFIRQKESTSK